MCSNHGLCSLKSISSVMCGKYRVITVPLCILSLLPNCFRGCKVRESVVKFLVRLNYHVWLWMLYIIQILQMSEIKQLPRVEVILNDTRENPSCPHGMSAVLFLISGKCFCNSCIIFTRTVRMYIVLRVVRIVFRRLHVIRLHLSRKVIDVCTCWCI
jgi:hypothetical protein